MIELEIDGKKVQVPEGSTVMHAAEKLGLYVPHFCYHPKLSIAANCRMCLVEVEKAPKPLPACATPVAAGMVVKTESARARQAQQAVMEFLLINHPLDCPICDQGGECQLQDLAVGYGGSASRYDEPKRVIGPKNLGPLVAAEEMSRCIQCTRCVRFGQEVAGVMELGMSGRGEHSEILSFVGQAVESELSGNMIDVCPVGALTSKPFRYQARTWELSRRRSVSGHDSLGSNLVVQVKAKRIVRVVPFENEAVNSCWLSDRDRFSYEGLYAADRTARPMLKSGGQWREVEWTDALEFVAGRLRAQADQSPSGLGILASPGSTLEEFALLARLARGLGSDNIDSRLRHAAPLPGELPADSLGLGMPVAELDSRDRVLLVGSFLRQEQPLLAVRLRAAVRNGAEVSVLHAADDDLLMPLKTRLIAAPDAWPARLAQIAAAVAALRGLAVPAGALAPDAAAQAVAQSLCSGQKTLVLAGAAALQAAESAQVLAWSQWIAQAAGAHFGVLPDGANQLGAARARALPGATGLNAAQMVAQPRSTYVLWNFEPEYDTADPAATMRALSSAQTVIACSPYRNGAMEYAHVILPLATFFETSGTFINLEGRAQSFNAACPPPGDARPGWKVLRVLGERLGLAGFAADSSEQVRDSLGELAAVQATVPAAPPASPAAGQGLVRVADVPLYSTDSLVRRAESLRRTAQARTPRALANAATLAQLGLSPGDKVRARQGDAAALLECAVDERLPERVVRVSAAHAATSTLGGMFAAISLERA